jgi:hypothetical protein
MFMPFFNPSRQGNVYIGHGRFAYSLKVAVVKIAASIIRSIALMMEAASTSETSESFIRLHGATTQKTAIFILAAVRT